MLASRTASSAISRRWRHCFANTSSQINRHRVELLACLRDRRYADAFYLHLCLRHLDQRITVAVMRLVVRVITGHLTGRRRNRLGIESADAADDVGNGQVLAVEGQPPRVALIRMCVPG